MIVYDVYFLNGPCSFSHSIYKRTRISRVRRIQCVVSGSKIDWYKTCSNAYMPWSISELLKDRESTIRDILE